MNDISEKQAARLLLLSLVFIVGYCFALLPLIYLGWSFLFPCNFQSGTMFLVHLAGEAIIAVCCLFMENKSWLAQYVESIFMIGAYASGYILIASIFKAFPDYSIFLNVKSIVVLTICLIVFISFMKIYRFDSSQKKMRVGGWWK